MDSEIDPSLPTYTEHGDDILTTISQLTTAPYSLPVTAYPLTIEDEAQKLQSDIVDAFFNGIVTKKDELVAYFIDQKLVTANTTDRNGRTPLIAAVGVGNIRMVQELADFNASIDDFGNYEGVQRTPLQVAAATGNLTLVKLFIETFKADDSIIAPDGQLALRLAVQGGHREVIDYLPLRRGGGWRRWKTQHSTAMRRVERALHGIYRFFKFFVWDLPKFFVWVVPKHLIVRPLKKSAKWCWDNKKGFKPWCKRQIVETPKRIGRAARWIGRTAKKVPKATVDFGKGCWEVLKDLSKWLYKVATVGVPKALKAVGTWLWSVLKGAAELVGGVVGRLVSFLHTAFTAVFTFFKELTLQDVLNGLKDFLRVVFVQTPQFCWAALCALVNTSYKVMGELFGMLGKCIWVLGALILTVILYVPRKIWEILLTLVASAMNGGHEVLVWINPKR